MACRENGTFLLRLEDIDQSRAKAVWEDLIYEDLSWLGLDWPRPVMRQSERMEIYREALQTLWDDGLLFACTCTRRDIEAAASAPQEGAPLLGPDGIVYPGTCRHRKRSAALLVPPQDAALRLDMQSAVTNGLSFIETGHKPGTKLVHADHAIQNIGDVVVARRDMGTSYHLSVVVDDAAQSISHVVRGLDLAEATDIHVILQRLLGLPTPVYHHHKLVRDEKGKRLAKRDDARALKTYRDTGLSADEVWAMIRDPN